MRISWAAGLLKAGSSAVLYLRALVESIPYPVNTTMHR